MNVREIAVVLAFAVGCTAPNTVLQSSPSLPSHTLTCGPATPLRSDPLQSGDLPGLQLGPLWFHAFDSGSSTATITSFLPGHPTKVLIEHAPGVGIIRLTGESCSTGGSLRFCYDPCYPPQPGSMAGAASTIAESIDLGVHTGYPGYMFFEAPGMYQLFGEKSGIIFGKVEIAVEGGR